MKFQYLGTAAAEGWPAVFCKCEHCLRAAEAGGKNIRTRSQAIINGDLLLDLPPDTYLHKLQHGLELSAVKYLLVTHCHMDHFYPQELSIRGSCYSPVMESPEMDVYCAAETKALFDRCTAGEIDEASMSALHWHILQPFEAVQAGPYTVTPLPANHMGQGNQPFVYHIVDEQGVSVYYLHDSGYYFPEVWDYFKRQKPADLISLDTTNGKISYNKGYGGHMGAPDILRVVREMREIGLADEHTRCVMNHFSHNGHLLHEELEALARPEGIEVAYDGMTLELTGRK